MNNTVLTNTILHKLYLNKVINYYSINKNKIKQINHNNKVYYELLISNNIENDKIYFETSPFICNKCNIFFNVYKKIYVVYLYILKKNLNLCLYDKILSKLKKYHNIKFESDLIGARTYWYIHMCHKCYK